MDRVKVCILLLGVLSVGCAITPVDTGDKSFYSIECDNLDNYKSVLGTEKYVASFLNSRDNNVEMYWINYEGDEVLKASISPGDTWSQNTYVTHPWVVRDLSGNFLAAYNVGSEKLVQIN